MLTTQQLQVLKQWVIDNANGVYDQATADLLNVIATPDYWVFKTSVSTDLAREAIDWGEVLTGSPLSQLKQWAFDTLIKNGDFNPSLENERVGFTSIFSGAAYVNTRTNLLNVSTRLATLGEKILSAVGTGPGGGDGSAQAASAVMTFEGLITAQHLVDASNS